MLFSTLLLLYNLTIAFVAGLVANKWLSKAIGTTTPILHPTLVVLIGWFAIGSVLQIFHLVHRIDLTAHLLIWMLLSIAFATHAKTLVKDAIASLHYIANKQTIAVGIGFFLITLVTILQRKADGDIGDYHLQAIRWAEEYAVVPGIGNIRRQLANNSNWFLLNAFSGFHFLHLRSVYVLNAALVIMVGMYVTPNLKQQFWLRNLVLLAYFTIVATRKYTGAVTNDLVVTSGIVLLFCWFTDLFSEQVKPLQNYVLLILLSLALVTYKLSALPMVLLGLSLIWVMMKQNLMSSRIGFTIIGLLLLFFLPWFITNVIQSGYLLFPAPSTNWFHTDWQMRPEIVNYEVYANLAYARAPEVDIEVARYFTFAQWWPHWIKSLDIFSMILLIGGSGFLLILISQLITNKTFRSYFITHQYSILAIVIVVALSLWFMHGPTPRFVFGYLIFTIAMGVSLFRNPTLQQLLHKRLVLISLFLVCSISAFQLYQLSKTNISQLFYTPPTYHQSTLNSYPVDGGYLWVPATKEQCWDALLPCTNLPDSCLQFRGKTLQDGFRISCKTAF